MRRVAAAMVVLAVGVAGISFAPGRTSPAGATEPVPQPRPECGEDTYTCPTDHAENEVTVSGQVIDGAPVNVVMDPVVPACNRNVGPVAGGWENAPCYSSISFGGSPSLCLTIDTFDDDRIRTGSCSALLYEDGTTARFELASEDARNHDSETPRASCGYNSSFGVYVEGGPSNRDFGPWPAKAATMLDCRYTLTSGRPNGLYGPTWAYFPASVSVRDNGPSSTYSGYAAADGGWAYVIGDLRDGGLEADLEAIENAVLGGAAEYTLDASGSTEPTDDPIVSYDFEVTAPDGSTDTRSSGSDTWDVQLLQDPEGGSTYTASVTVTSESGATDTETVEIELPAGINIEEFAAVVHPEPDGEDPGGEDPEPEVSTKVDINLLGVDHDIFMEEGDYTIELEWLEPAPGEGPGISLGAPTEMFRTAEGPYGDEDPFDVFYMWEPPTEAGTYRVRVNLDLTTSDGTHARASRTTSPFDVIGGEIDAQLSEEVSDSDEPAFGIVDQLFEFDLTLQNIGWDDATIVSVELTRDVEGVDIEFEPPDDETLVPEADTVMPVTVSSSQPGEAEIPFTVTYQDTAVGEESEREIELSAYLNFLGDFEWRVPDRIVRPTGGGSPDIPDSAGDVDDVQHDSYPVDITIVAEDCLTDYDWTANGEEIDDPEPTPDREDPCQFRFEFEDEGEYELIGSDGAAEVLKGTVTVEDILWVVVGDSVASGEGNPDGGSGGGWMDSTCHRSANSGAVQAAFDYEEEYELSSVTLVHVACSGATTFSGVIGPQLHNPFYGADASAHQLALVQSLVGDREIDALVMHVGGNDMLFGPAAKFCFANGGPGNPCNDIGFASELNIQSGNVTQVRGIPVPEVLDPFVGSVCRDAAAGEREINAAGDGDIDASTASDWHIIVNDEDVDWTGRTPVNINDPGALPTDWEQSDIESIAPRLCPGDWAERVFSGGHSAASSLNFVLEDELEENHFSGYLPTRAPNPLGEPEPLTEIVKATGPDLDDAIKRRVEAFEQNLAALDSRVDLMNVDPANVFIVEYYNLTRGSDGETCDTILEVPFTGLGIDKAEAMWAEAKILDPLNREIAATRSRFGWTVVGGVASAFTTHGACADESWIIGLEDETGAGNAGLLHPNAAGHEAIKDLVMAAVDGVVEDPSDARGSDPTASDRLAQAAAEGSNVLRLAGDGDLAPAAASASLALTAAGDEAELAVGDWLLVGAGNERTADYAFPLPAPQLVEVTAINGRRITFEPALDQRHGASTLVVRVPDVSRQHLEDPYDPTQVAGPTSELFSCDPDATAPFVDLPGTKWGDPAIICLYDIDVTTGTSPTMFSPDDVVTRMQMAAFMARLYEVMVGEPCPVADTPFTDLLGSPWGDPAIGCIYGLDVTTGTSPTTYSPNDVVTRMQVAAFLDRLWQAIRGEKAPKVPTPFIDLPGNYADSSIARIFGLDLTTGTSPTMYSPYDDVTRVQMAALLARFYEADPP